MLWSWAQTFPPIFGLFAIFDRNFAKLVAPPSNKNKNYNCVRPRPERRQPACVLLPAVLFSSAGTEDCRTDRNSLPAGCTAPRHRPSYHADGSTAVMGKSQIPLFDLNRHRITTIPFGYQKTRFEIRRDSISDLWRIANRNAGKIEYQN